jgi:hypothetical protein
MNKKYLLILAIITLMSAAPAIAQFPKIKLPGTDKITKPQPGQPQPGTPASPTNPTASSPAASSGGVGKSAGVYLSKPTSTPLLLKDTLDVQTHRIQGYRDNTKQWAWLPKIRFYTFHDGASTQRINAEWYKPDGSLWFTEALRANTGSAKDGAIFVRSEHPTPEMDKNASITPGLYGVKVVNTRSGETMFQGKFKVAKTPPLYDDPSLKNQTDFYVENDWLMPMAYVGYDVDENFEAPRPHIWMWFKGEVDANQLEARLFYNGQQIASTDDNCNNCIRPASSQQIRAEGCSQFASSCRWAQYGFYWTNFITINEQYDFFKSRVPNTTATNDAPGEYTVKVFYKGQQIREAKFNVNPKGSIAQNSFSSQIFLPHHKVLVPVKVMGTGEKWNATAWKTDMLYGNPLTGFLVP